MRSGCSDAADPVRMGKRSMAAFKFRLRVNLVQGDRFEFAGTELPLFNSLSGEPVHLRTATRDTPIGSQSRALLVGGPYTSEDAAWTGAAHARESLLIWAVRSRFGIDLGDGHARSVLTGAGKKHFEEQYGKPVRADFHGVDIYEDKGGTLFLNIAVDGHVAKNAMTFAEEIRSISGRCWNLSEKQRLASELYCASFFDSVLRSRFITLVTAVEALLDQLPRPKVVSDFVDDAVASVGNLDVDGPTRQALISSLDWLRRESIGQSGRRLADQLLEGREYGELTPGKFFSRCYKVRSQTVHRGTPDNPSVDFFDLANLCQVFVGDLLSASFDASASDGGPPAAG